MFFPRFWKTEIHFELMFPSDVATVKKYEFYQEKIRLDKKACQMEDTAGAALNFLFTFYGLC